MAKSQNKNLVSFETYQAGIFNRSATVIIL